MKRFSEMNNWSAKSLKTKIKHTDLANPGLPPPPTPLLDHHHHHGVILPPQAYCSTHSRPYL